MDYWQRGRITSEQAMGLIEMLVVAKLECDAGKMVADAFSPPISDAVPTLSRNVPRRSGKIEV